MLEQLKQDLTEQLYLASPTPLAELILKLRFTDKIQAKNGRIIITLDGGTNNNPEDNSTINKIKTEIERLSKPNNLLFFTLKNNELVLSNNLNSDNQGNHKISYNQVKSAPSRSLPENPWNINIVDMQIPPIPVGSKVIEINAGTGLMSQKLLNEVDCELKALSPCYKDDHSFEECKSKLGENHVAKMPLEEAVEKFPQIYAKQFDVALIFDFDIPYVEKEEFIQALSQCIKPNGVAYLYSRHKEELSLNNVMGRSPYLIKTAKLFFDTLSIDEITTEKGCYGLLTLKSPKEDPPSLED